MNSQLDQPSSHYVPAWAEHQLAANQGDALALQLHQLASHTQTRVER